MMLTRIAENVYIYRATDCDYIYYWETGQIVKISVYAIVEIPGRYTIQNAENAIKEDMKNDTK